MESLLPRPVSQISSSAGSAGSSWGQPSTRPTSFGSDASTSNSPATGSSTAAFPEKMQQSDFRPPKHVLMRLRRTSMPNVPLLSDSTTGGGGGPQAQAKLPIPNHIAMQKKRLSTASARSCDSLPEESEAELDLPVPSHSQIPKSAPAERMSTSLPISDIPLPSRRIRPKANIRRSSMNPSTSTSSSPSGSRPTSIALPSTTPVVASNTNGETQAVESKTLARNLKVRLSPNKQAVRFDAPATRSILTAQAYNTAKKTARNARKDRIANEILETERVYVATLSDVQTHFLEPLLAKAKSQDPANPPILPDRAIKEIFSNFGDVYNLAKEILKRLEESVSSVSSPIPVGPPSSFQIFAASSPGKPIGSIRTYVPPSLPVPQQIGRTLLPVLPFLKCYSLFVGNFAAAQARLDQEDKGNEAWRSFIAERRAIGVGGKLNLSAMLLCIVQRVPRYRLLLGDLLRFTDTNDPDYEALHKARAAVEEVANHLEGSIKQHESSVAMLDLQRSLVGLDFQLIAPGRRLLKSGILVKQGRRVEEERAFFLFTDMLLYADVQYGWTRAISSYQSAGNEHHAYMPSAASDRSRMSVLLPGSGIGGLGAANATLTFKRKLDLADISVVGSEGHAFEILSSVKSFSVIASTSQSKYEWVTAIRDAKEDLLKSMRSLLTAEDEQRRSRLRRLSMPAAPSRSISTPILSTLLGARTLVMGDETSRPPIVRLPSLDDEDRELDADDNFDDPEFGAAKMDEDSRSSVISPASDISTSAYSRRSAQSSGTDARLAGGIQNLKVYEDYRAPIWVPDNRAERCMRCREPFAVWRRRHHCRLCGDVVCWACSTKRFAIPAEDSKGTARIGRACDVCYETCFSMLTPTQELLDPLSVSLGASLVSSANPVPPLLKKAASAFDVSYASHSKDGSGEKQVPNRVKPRTSLSSPRESVEILRSVLARSG